MYVDIFVCMHACMYVGMYVCIHVSPAYAPTCQPAGLTDYFHTCMHTTQNFLPLHPKPLNPNPPPTNQPSTYQAQSQFSSLGGQDPLLFNKECAIIPIV